MKNILYRDKSKESTRKVLELIKKFRKIAGYKIHIRKSVEFLYTSIELIDKKDKKELPFTIAAKRVKYLEINLTKDVKVILKTTKQF